MKRIIPIVSLVAVVAFATPCALAQKPGKEKDKGKEEQTSPLGPRSQPKPAQPQPKPAPRSNPQPPPQPQPQPQPQPRRFDPDPPKTSGKSTGQPPELDPRRFRPPPTETPQGKSSQPPPKSGGGDAPIPTGRQIPRGFGPPDEPQDAAKRGQIPKTGNKPDFTPPTRGEPTPRVLRGNPEDSGQGGDAARRRSITPSGKPRQLPPVEAPKTSGPPPIDPAGNQPAEPVPLKKPLGRPSGGRFAPKPEGDAPGAAPVNAPKSVLKPSVPVKTGDAAGTPSVGAPGRFRSSKKAPRVEDAPLEKAAGKPVPIKSFKPVAPVTPVPPPEGGRVFRGGAYRHEYSRHRSSSFALGIGISDGSTALSFGYARGGSHSAFALGFSSGHNHGFGHDHLYHPYWHSPVWYEPVYYTPCYAVAAPVYYSPLYVSPVCDPWAYNSSSFAFGYSSFGGSALSSFSFAYSTSHWSAGFGWTTPPCYTIYTPVYDPWFRSVWEPGYYEIVDEDVWVDGGYEEVVTTPVVETVVDPLGNTYDVVIQPGSVDYRWNDGHLTRERRRIWHEGRFVNVAVF